MERVARALRQVVGELGIPSASVAVRIRGDLVFAETVGLARLDPALPAIADQPYDLASLTKPLAAATVAAALVEAGRLAPTDPVGRWVPQVHAELTVRHLVEHAGRFPAWAPLHEQVPREAWGTDAARRTIIDAACRSGTGEPGSGAVYSDLGFLVLLRVLEEVGGARLDELLSPWTEGFDLRWGWPGAAATQRPVPGEVHDPLAFAMGGVSAHAGLFGTARGVAAFAEAVLDAAAGRADRFPGRVVGQAWRAPSPGGHRFGWDTVRPGTGSTGPRWPRDTVGHLGYTGTSVWMSPSERVVVALLTNRVHPDDDKRAILPARIAVHDAVARELGWC